ncbi:uncharacterized protein LOC105847656 [Hydra vulgaris]|uniref:uncharacterized protein LOC105847656 n=1 Tax=Hydra vulgaris TaxID=6087 RepID=UPI0006412360|nr:uncharacterized protein LOC105847656 [Hydra vulgaris]
MELPAKTIYFFFFIVSLHAFIDSLHASIVIVEQIPIQNDDEQRLNNSITTDLHTFLPYTKIKVPMKQCYNDIYNCLQSSPFKKNKCLKKFRKCSSKHCSAKECFIDARKCTMEVETLQKVLKCIRTLKTCIKKKGC